MTKLLAWSAAMLLMVGAHPAVAVGNADQGRPATIPIRAFAALPQLRRPLLSPNGRQIVALNEMDGITSLALINCDQPDAAPHFIRIGKTTITDLRWAGSRRLLLTIRASQKIGSEEIPFLRLLALDVPSGASRVVDTKSRGIYAGDVLYSDPTGSWASVASQDDVYSYPSVKRVDLATGEARLVEKARDDVWDWYADDQGVVRAGIAYQGRRWTIWYRDKADEKLTALRGKLAKADDSTVDRIIFGRDANSWVVTNERTGRFGLYRYDLRSGAV